MQLGKPQKGFFKEAGDDAFLRVDTEGNIIGFAILDVSKREKQIDEVELPIKASFFAITFVPDFLFNLSKLHSRC